MGEEEDDSPAAIMLRLDTNKDGKLSMAEILAELHEDDRDDYTSPEHPTDSEETTTEHAKKVAAKAFKAADADTDALISAEELPKMLEVWSAMIEMEEDDLAKEDEL